MSCGFLPLRRAVARLTGALALLLALIPASAAAAPESAWDRNDHAALRLVSATTSVGVAETLRLGLHFRLAPGWKIYWRSPGDAGLPPRIDWSGSENLAAAEIRWPAPVRFELFGLDTFGYGDEVVLPIDAKPARPGDPVRLSARVDYLICETICIPYEAQLRLALPAGAAQPSEHAHLIDRFVARVPGEGSGIAIERVELSAGAEPRLSVHARALVPFAAPDVFVEGPQGWSFARPVAERSDGGRQLVLQVPVRREAAAPGDTLIGKTVTLTLVDGARAAERTLTVAAGAAPVPDVGLGLVGILALAVLGGFILNFMPCVLPVLSLKLLNVVGHGGAARTTVRMNFLASAAGIVVSFLALAGMLLALKASGHAVGWGIQFQSPVFLAFMTLLLVLFAANLWGWFEISLPSALAGAMDRVPGSTHEGRWGAFLTGAFATLLATPCSAPFLGTAVGFALASGPAEIIAVFAALGIGLALPYLLVAAAPGLARLLPRPGRWMIGLRRALGVALLGTAAWLLSVVAAQIGAQGAAVLSVLLVVLLGVLWAARGRSWLRVAGVATLAALALAVPAGFRAEPAAERAADAEPGWRAWDRAEIDRLVRAGHVVFVDVTADWCITCQVNKTLVLARGEVAARLAGEGPDAGRIVAMRADWTRPDPRISGYLASFGRYGIPFNAVYGPAAPQGIALPELLTSDVVLAALDRAAGRAQAAVPGR